MFPVIETPWYNIAKFLAPQMNPITSNEVTVKEIFSFAKEINDQDSYLVAGRLDDDSLLTNIPLDELLIFLLIIFIINKKIYNYN